MDIILKKMKILNISISGENKCSGKVIFVFDLTTFIIVQ